MVINQSYTEPAFYVFYTYFDGHFSTQNSFVSP